ncbi:hypothetical protein [Labrys monachus]|uniref:Uncharacterized protein n=1 Tax=Labrys monachus TaxID=217067 RepID=A0ABU0F6J3_9HYPH|nr:hypothetical protein [Labrys monachus]MDQ0390238.1 hypothetical protein [Labrys monachus]
MRVRQVRIRLENWYPANYSAANTHDHELELYLWVDGRRTYQVFDYGASDVLAQGGLPGGVPADIREPRFRIRLVAIERDGWPDATGGAGGEITIELDRDPPVSTWTIVADGAGGDRPVEITFAVEYLTYLATPDHPGPDPHPIDDKARSDAGDRDARVFEHWLGLGRSSRLWPDPARKYHEQVWFIVPLDGEGRRGKQIVTTYRYRAEAIGLDHGRMGSVYVPRNTQIVLHQHDFAHPDFAAGKSLRLGHPGLHNLNETRWDDRIGAIELITTHFVAAAPRAAN